MPARPAARLLALAALLAGSLGGAVAGDGAGPQAALGEAGDGHGAGASLAPFVLEPGWTVEPVRTGLRFPVALAARGSELLVLEQGRYVYASSYAGQDAGALRALAFGPGGSVAAERVVAQGLADPMGLAVGDDGTVWLTHFHGLARIPGPAYGEPMPPVLPFSSGHPTQASDAIFLPVTGQPVEELVDLGLGDPLAHETTGPMGVALRPGDGQPFATQAAHGVPPDDVVVRDLSGLDYDNPYSSSILAPTGGPLTPDQVAARACRNCFDLAFAPGHSAFPGQLFVTENVGVYRARLAAGTGRTILEGSTATDWNVLDGVNVVDLEAGKLRRVATFRPDGALLGSSPTGIAFAPPTFTGHGGAMFVALWSGFVPPTADRGSVDLVVLPDLASGLGVGVPWVAGLDFPTDVAFGPDGAMYVLEYFTGTLWRVRPA